MKSKIDGSSVLGNSSPPVSRCFAFGFVGLCIEEVRVVERHDGVKRRPAERHVGDRGKKKPAVPLLAAEEQRERAERKRRSPQA